MSSQALCTAWLVILVMTLQPACEATPTVIGERAPRQEEATAGAGANGIGSGGDDSTASSAGSTGKEKSSSSLFQNGVFSWQNPLGRLPADSGFLRLEGQRFLFFGAGKSAVEEEELHAWASEDGATWTLESVVLRARDFSWCKEGLSDPDIIESDGKFYMVFDCHEVPGSGAGARVGLAVSDQLLGPYLPVSDLPLRSSITPALLVDDSDRTWVFTFGISQYEIDLATGTTVGTELAPIGTGPSGAWDEVGISQPTVMQRNGTSYLFYSAWTRGLEVGVATAASPAGPWTKQPNNPIYGATNPVSCASHGLTCELAPGNPFGAIGASNIFLGPDGEPWLASRAVLVDGDSTFLTIDPIHFDSDGMVEMEVSWKPRSISID